MFSFPDTDGTFSSTACSNATAFGIGSRRSAKEFALRISVGTGPVAGAAAAPLTVPSVAIAPISPAIFFSIKHPPDELQLTRI
jgi:hypothetical protein